MLRSLIGRGSFRSCLIIVMLPLAGQHHSSPELSPHECLPTLAFRVLFLSSLIQCLPQASLSPFLFLGKFNIPTSSLLTSCAACLLCPTYFPGHQLLVLSVFCLHSSIGFGQYFFLIIPVIVTGDLPECKVFQILHSHRYSCATSTSVLSSKYSN